MYRQALNMFAAFAAMVAASVVFPSFGEDGKDTADGGNVLVEKRAKPLEWLFPMGDATPHEGMAFADGVTGVLAWRRGWAEVRFSRLPRLRILPFQRGGWRWENQTG